DVLTRAEIQVCLFFQAEDGIRDWSVTGVQTCALPISEHTMALIFAPSHRPIHARQIAAAGEYQRHRVLGDRNVAVALDGVHLDRSEERRVGKECRSRGLP